MLTLFKTITGGEDWGNAAAPLEHVNIVWMLIYVSYVSFCVIAVLNVVTSVFCQSAIENGQLDLDQVIHYQLRSRQAYVDRISKFFSFLDEDNSGGVSCA